MHGECVSPNAAGAGSMMVHLACWHGVQNTLQKHAGPRVGASQGRPSRTHGAVHVGLRPHGVVLVVDHFGPAHDVKVPHHVLLDVCQSGDLAEVPCQTHQPASTTAATYPEKYYLRNINYVACMFFTVRMANKP